MRVAFTGKGGSGKSTVAALFIRHLCSSGRRVLAIDADINLHLAELLGTQPKPGSALSHPDIALAVRAHLLGDNALIGGVERFVKSTPPGPGSRRVRLDEADPVVGAWSAPTPAGALLMHVGTYEPEGIGASCFHTNLAVLENLLSHLELGTDEWLVCDMVAGTDAFSNTLHAQFDRIFVVVEPTPESVTVARRYLELADAAGVTRAVAFVGNKVSEDADGTWLGAALAPEPLTTQIQLAGGLKRARQAGRPPVLDDLPDPSALEPLVAAAREGGLSEPARSALLRALHAKIAHQEWVRAAHGDVTDQFADA